MKKLEFSININAPKEKVWEALWKDENYRKWTSVFSEGSYAESDFEKGSEFRFLNPQKDGVWGEITEMIPNERMYFTHKGEVHKGVNQPKTYGEDSVENYDLTEEKGITILKMTLNAPEDYVEYFVTTIPKSLEEVKKIAEG